MTRELSRRAPLQTTETEIQGRGSTSVLYLHPVLFSKSYVSLG